MQFRPLRVEGAIEVTPRQFPDSRGMFAEGFRADKLAEHIGFELAVRQTNISVSSAGAVRGIHYASLPPSQAKYVTALSGVFLDFIVDIRVGSLAYDTAAAGKTKSNAFVVGADVFLFYASQNATQYDPSFAKTFSARAGNIFDVRMYREEPRVDVIAVDWTKQTKVVSALCGRRLSIT